MNIHRFRLQLPCFALLSGNFPELNVFQARHAGHSKWSNIKFKKMIIDNARAKVFGKMSLEIIQAVKGKIKTWSVVRFVSSIRLNAKEDTILKIYNGFVTTLLYNVLF